MNTDTPNRDIPRVALVTGAARGIGLATAVKLLQAGHRVAMVDVDSDALMQAVASLPSDRVMPLCMNITDLATPKLLDEAVRAVWEPVSILVNNAAVSPKHNGKAAGLEQLTGNEWQFVMEVNVGAPMRLAQCFVPYMREQRWGRIVNLSSRAGRSIANAAGPAYMTSKAAILGLTRSIACDYAPFGVTANAVAPGLVETQLALAVSPDLLALIRARTAMGRGGLPEEIAAVVAFLASNDAGFITGACVDVNGGAFMS